MRVKRMLPLCILLIGLVVCYHFRYQLQAVYKAFAQEGNQKKQIEFPYWQEVNSDIYAWIRMEDTQIDYPIVQCEEEGYYLKHDVQKDPNIYGAIYTEHRNSKTFTDANTVVYGHHMRDKSMFGVLGDFLNRDFFEAHRTIEIFTPEAIRSYQVVAAYEYPAEHLLASYDLSTPESINKYMEQIPSFVQNTGGVLDHTIDIKAPLLTLSTCTPDHASMRYLVQAVLVEERPIDREISEEIKEEISEEIKEETKE